jgi:hypothetical protein
MCLLEDEKSGRMFCQQTGWWRPDSKSPIKSPNKTGIFILFSQRTVFMFIKEKFEDATI